MRFHLLLWLILLAVGCSSPTAHDPSDDVVVQPGHEDDYYGAEAREYYVSGTGTVTLEDSYTQKSDDEKLARAKQLVQLKNVAIGWFLNTYLTDKEDSDSNHAYGGFSALVRFASEDDSTPSTTDGKNYSFHYKVQVGGSPQLIDKLGGSTFTLQLGKPSNDEMAQLDFDHEWYRNDPWASFDPSKLSPDQLETMQMGIVEQTQSRDAYLAYDRLFADGELSIAVHFGWDYWSRYDITGSRNLYNALVQNGFTSPVDAYEKYDRTSGPLTKTIQSNGKPVNVKVWIFHPGDAAHGVPGPDPDTDDGGKVLEADMRDSLAHREVIMYLGHSGALYGFSMANWNKTNEGDMDDSKLPTADMPRTYQIVLANGCETYDLGQAFWLNPAKADHQNLNVITTTDFSNAGTEASAERLINALTNQTGDKVIPVKVSELTTGLDEDQGWGFSTMYGVHGVDANPKLDPTGDVSKLCQSCATDTDCGADGNRCTGIADGVTACTIGCVDDSACPSGYGCRAIASASSRTITSHQCVPTSLSCQ